MTATLGAVVAPRRLTSRLSSVGPLGTISAIVIGVAALLAVIGPWIAPHDPDATDGITLQFQIASGHLLGYDANGRDVFSRLLAGARTSMLGPVVVVAASITLGVVLAIATAWRGGRFASGRKLDKAPEIFIGAAANPFAPPYDFRPLRLAKKIAAGAQFVQTQLNWDLGVVKRWIGRLNDEGLTDRLFVLVGIVASFCNGTVIAISADLFPTRIRFSGVAMSFNLSFTLLSGLAPVVAALLARQTGQAIALRRERIHPDDRCGTGGAEDHVSGAGILVTGVRVVSTDDHVVEAVAVDVSGRRNGIADVAGRDAAGDENALAGEIGQVYAAEPAGFSEDEIDKPRLAAAGGADEEIVDAVAVEVTDRRKAASHLVARGALDRETSRRLQAGEIDGAQIGSTSVTLRPRVVSGGSTMSIHCTSSKATTDTSRGTRSRCCSSAIRVARPAHAAGSAIHSNSIAHPSAHVTFQASSPNRNQ